MTFLSNPYFLKVTLRTAQVKANAVSLTLPQEPVNSDGLVAIGFGYANAPGINTGAGWTEIATAAHNASVNDPYIRAAYLMVTSTLSATVAPFTAVAGIQALAVFNVLGLDPTWTPTFVSATDAVSSTTNSVTDSLTTGANNTYCLFAGSGEHSVTDPGVPTLSGGSGWTDIGTDHANNATVGINIGASVGLYATSGTSVSRSYNGNASSGVSTCIISLTPTI